MCSNSQPQKMSSSTQIRQRVRADIDTVITAALKRLSPSDLSRVRDELSVMPEYFNGFGTEVSVDVVKHELRLRRGENFSYAWIPYISKLRSDQVPSIADVKRLVLKAKEGLLLDLSLYCENRVFNVSDEELSVFCDDAEDSDSDDDYSDIDRRVKRRIEKNLAAMRKQVRSGWLIWKRATYTPFQVKAN